MPLNRNICPGDEEPGTEGLPVDYRVFPDGRIQDLRYPNRRGTLVRVISGPHRGLTGRVESATFDRHSQQPGYQVRLAGEKWAELRWDAIRAAGRSEPGTEPD